MTQLNLFPGSAALRRTPGDIASSTEQYIWALEMCTDGVWKPFPLYTGTTRKEVREYCKDLRAMGCETRTVPYKACIDRQGRYNRQVLGERRS